MSILLLALPKREYSENENRYLQKMPEFSVKSLVAGDFNDKLDDYLSDHFPLRDFWISLKTLSEEAMGKRSINGIYIGKDGYLIGEYEHPKNTERIVKTLTKFSGRLVKANPDVNVRLMLVPNAVSVLDDKLPAMAVRSEQYETMETIVSGSKLTSVDVASKLIAAKDNSQIYYKTDHHWNGYGAYCGYEAYCESLGIEPVDIDYFIKEDVTDDFHGTLSAKVNRFFEKGDTITIFTDPEADLTVKYEDTGEITNTLYNMEYLDKRDKYSLFLNNLHPFVEISNENSDTDRVLMLVKDSYANCMVPYLLHDFRKIYVFDTRYYKDGPGGFFEEHSEITDVLILYNMNTIDTDTGIRGIY